MKITFNIKTGILLLMIIMAVFFTGCASSNNIKAPSVIGMTEVGATNALEQEGLKLKIVGKEFSEEYQEGRIIKQDPLAAESVREGDTLNVYISKGVSPVPVRKANFMEFMDISVDLQPDGSGIVTETRRMNLTKDTEIYIVMENLGGSEISNFKVSDFGKSLVYEQNWDIDASRSEKAGKYGVVKTDDGVELCWGIGEYGEHEYTVTYTISGMVRQLEDGQAMNWKLFDGHGNINPEELTIKVSGPNPFTIGNTKMWGFGFEGEINFQDGNLVGKSSRFLSDSNYVTLLMQFVDSPFQPTLSLDKMLVEQEMLAK